MTKLYIRIKKLLETYPELRASDKKLLWAVWSTSGLAVNGSITKENFYKANSSESVTRARRKVQELHPELNPPSPIQQAREDKEKEKGTFIFRETLFE